MQVSVRDTLENLGFDVGYDNNTGGVLVKDKNGKGINIGNEKFTLSDDGRYYTDDVKNVYNALAKNNLSIGKGWQGARNYLSPTEQVGYNDSTKQVSINGKDYNVDNKSLANIGGIVYGKTDFLDSLKSQKSENGYDKFEEKVIKLLFNSSYDGWDAKNDASYKSAMKDYMKNAAADMGSRGILSDSLLSHYASQGAQKLAPAFAKDDYERYKDERQADLSLLDKLDSIKKTDTNAFLAQQNVEKEKGELALSKEKADVNNYYTRVKTAIERANTLGSVSKEDAYILGALEGELTDEAKARLQEKEFEIEKYKTKAEIDFNYWQSEFNLTKEEAIEAYKIKSELNINEEKAAAYYKFIYGK